MASLLDRLRDLARRVPDLSRGFFDAFDIIATIAATELALESLDFPVELGRGVGAAQRVFSKSGVTA